MTPGDPKFARTAAVTVAALVALRLAVAAFTPLTFDEAYYWTWSKHLAGGYYDHPPMVAFVIRLGTMIAGDTAFGVRVVSILLALPMSWAVYRTALILFDSMLVAAMSAIFLNVTLMAAVGTTIVTPDAPLLVASSFVLFFLAKVYETGRGVWWLAVGASVGCALLSKYTALFFGAEILLWLVWFKGMRRWLASPWPYLGGIIAFAVFSPTVLWNADHQWVSFVKQLGRARVEGMTLKYIGEMIPTQFAFATPLVFILGVFGLVALAKRGPGPDAARGLVTVSFWVIFVYFLWHALHDRVEANWLGPIYPAFSIAAAYAAWGVGWDKPSNRRTVEFCRRWAFASGVVLFLLLIVQTNTGLLSGYRRDASVRSVGVGWTELAQEIEALRVKTGAQCILSQDYGSTAWMMFYMPKGTCVAQRGDRYRWDNMPEPDASLLKSKVLLVGFLNGPDRLKDNFERIEKIGDVKRKRSGIVVETYEIDLAEGAKGDVLDRSPPPELIPR
ncbi:MAG: glycosyltransferase family 39 protein [Afipia sp.]|nr:glycosyltransferase family 39 protein [Afipia sp.]